MTAKTSVPVPATVEDYLAQSNPDVLRAMVKMFAEQLMSAEADALCGAEYGHVSVLPGVAAGTASAQRAGADLGGGERYLLGVSTRRVEKLAAMLGVTQLSKSQVSEMAKSLDARVAEFRNRPLDGSPYTFVWADALVMKVREGGRVVTCTSWSRSG